MSWLHPPHIYTLTPREESDYAEIFALLFWPPKFFCKFVTEIFGTDAFPFKIPTTTAVPIRVNFDFTLQVPTIVHDRNCSLKWRKKNSILISNLSGFVEGICTPEGCFQNSQGVYLPCYVLKFKNLEVITGWHNGVKVLKTLRKQKLQVFNTPKRG